MKWSIIGCGNISKRFCEDLSMVKDANILSIASKNPEKLKIFGDKYKVPKDKRFLEYEKILETNFDVAYIGLINSLHKKVINVLAKESKNIIVEKPCFLSLKDFTDCEDLIKKKRILFIESMMNLHHPQTAKIFEILKSDKIGQVLSFDFKFGFDIRKKFLYFFKKKINFLSRLTDPDLGGGAINDLGCYGIAFSNKIASFLGHSSYYKIKKRNIIGKTGVDENSKIEISYNEQFKSYLHVAFDQNLGNSATIIGTKGSLHIPSIVTPNNNYKLILKTNDVRELKFSSENLYTYIIRDVERYLKENIEKPDNYGLNLEEIKINLKMLDDWKLLK